MVKKICIRLTAIMMVVCCLPLFLLTGIAATDIPEGQIIQREHRYQGTLVMVQNPLKQALTEQDLTTAQMAEIMGSHYDTQVSSATEADILHLLQYYWLSNSVNQLLSTFQSFSGARCLIRIRFAWGLPDSLGQNAWAWCYYYGYGNSGLDNHMSTISIVLDLEDCLSSSAGGLVSGTGDKIKFDQIVAHELMHALMAEIAPGYMLGPTQRDWFNEGSAEMISGGMSNIASGTAAQICGGFGIGSADYASSYLAASYISWLSACNGYGERCAVSAANLSYGLDRILARLRQTGDLNEALYATTGMRTAEFEKLVRSGDNGNLQRFLEDLRTASTNSEGILGAGSVLGGNLKLQGTYVVRNTKYKLSENSPIQFSYNTAA